MRGEARQGNERHTFSVTAATPLANEQRTFLDLGGGRTASVCVYVCVYVKTIPHIHFVIVRRVCE